MKINTNRGFVTPEDATPEELRSALRLAHHFAKAEAKAAEFARARVFALELENERLHLLLDMAEEA